MTQAVPLVAPPEWLLACTTHRLKKVRTDNEAERAQLQERRHAQEMATRQQRRRHALRAHGEAEDEHTGRDHREPIGREQPNP